MTETKSYHGETGTQAYDGWAGLTLGTRYTGTAQDGIVYITLPSGRATSVTLEQWQRWFKK